MKRFIDLLINPQPKFLTESKFKIVEAFELDGVKYYQFDDPYNTPCTRAMSAIKYYEEMRMKCNLEYLTAWVEAQKNIIKSAKEDLSLPRNNRLNLSSVFDNLNKLDTMNTRLNERLYLAFDMDLIYKLASVVFFDGTENPNIYEQKYGMQKIEKWKKFESVQDFFLRQPIKRLVPFLDGHEQHIQTYQEMVEQIKSEDTKEVLENLSSTQKTKYTSLTS